MTRRDLQALRRVIQHVSSSDINIQQEVLRLDGVLEKALRDFPTKDKNNGPKQPRN